ncbi:hypothetical protein BD324DRAFT_621968 [Kockovaella imperatae]|uniref:Peptidase M20 dimerisation domain-containing protein n=1 Tax=Kockovaella imperatae TaxID=4999 RepID=A0A1Y1UL34_9TREE|nr:hypothetical protein BD324DRAFT_621968 [Kockovaella imperatae]ORX38699.1 hypothetical protein BD324DRAFT_621968 [Kockovaella imperatae]
MQAYSSIEGLIQKRHDEWSARAESSSTTSMSTNSIKRDSLTWKQKGNTPALSHLLSVQGGRVLSLAADENCVYAGCQSLENEIVVFSRNTLRPMFKLLGHQGSVLALMIVEDRGWLVSSSSAGDVRIWSTKTFEPVYIIHPCDDTSGDIYSLAWDDRAGGTLYFGSQSASIEWINFADPGSLHQDPTRTRKASLQTAASHTVAVSSSEATSSSSKPTPPSLPRQRTGRYRPHKFFDNPPISGSTTPTSPVPGCKKGHSYATSSHASPQLANLNTLEPTVSRHSAQSNGEKSLNGPKAVELDVGPGARIAFAHFGYVYALHLIPRNEGQSWLVSGSGDSDIKIWLCKAEGGLKLIQTFQELSGAVHSLAFRDSLLFAGMQDGQVGVWDLETFACIRNIDLHAADVLALSVLGEDLYAGAADGQVARIDGKFENTSSWAAHEGIVLSSVIVQATHGWEYITAGNDSFVKIWSISRPSTLPLSGEIEVEGEGDTMLLALSKLIAVPTVSDEAHRESCRQGAHLLKRLLQQLGAQSEVISGENGRNPLVLATFVGRETGRPRKRVLFYGHYDVQPAAEAGWESDPWTLAGRNGYLYGRGVSDNKGPILAVACAASSLRQKRELDVDLVMLIEGEEEAGSRGFAPTVRKHKDAIGHIDVVLLSNSTWVGEDDPCVVFGMRGVVYAHLEISSKGADAHSGVDGGSVAEPMFDMIRVLGGIADSQGVRIPDFYDQVRSPTPEEMQHLTDVSIATGRSVEDLSRVWRDPSFSIANISSTGSSNKTVIPRRVTADISMRIVPDQDLETITANLKAHCKNLYDDLHSSNTFEIKVTHSASWWLTSLDSPYFKSLECAIEDVWGAKPLKIREGGTVPTIFWLEREFGAPCVHLPLGQASDAGHLANERMRLLNLRNGKRVVESYLARLALLE